LPFSRLENYRFPKNLPCSYTHKLRTKVLRGPETILFFAEIFGISVLDASEPLDIILLWMEHLTVLCSVYVEEGTLEVRTGIPAPHKDGDIQGGLSHVGI
jgi:hypothetical protein